jgi:hypothetical protein
VDLLLPAAGRNGAGARSPHHPSSEAHRLEIKKDAKGWVRVVGATVRRDVAALPWHLPADRLGRLSRCFWHPGLRVCSCRAKRPAYLAPKRLKVLPQSQAHLPTGCTRSCLSSIACLCRSTLPWLLARFGHSPHLRSLKTSSSTLVRPSPTCLAQVAEARSATTLMKLVEEGLARRHTSSTLMNVESSRSHLIINITVETTNLQTQTLTRGKLSFVDLAGSERCVPSGLGLGCGLGVVVRAHCRLPIALGPWAARGVAGIGSRGSAGAEAREKG